MRTRRTSPVPASWLAAGALLLAAAALPAMDVVGDPPPPYLAERLRADWRLMPLGRVLDQIGTFIEKPLTRSKNVVGAADRLVVQVDERKVPLRELLELLERTQGLHIVAEALRLRVETVEDFRDRRRRPVNLSLRDFATAVAARDFPGPELAFQTTSGGGGFDTFANEPASAPHVDAQDVLDRLKAAAGGGDASLADTGNVYLLVTPEEEQAMRDELQRQFERTTRRSAWRITFGIAPADQPAASGVVAAAAARTVAAALTDGGTLTVAALNGQRVSSSAIRGHAYVADAEVVNDRLDPTVRVMNLGVAADLRPVLGLEHDVVAFKASWAFDTDTGRVRIADVRHGGGRAPDAAVTGTVKLERKDDKVQEGPVSLTPPAADGRPGERVPIEQPEVWVWQPVGEVYLARDQSLVLVAAHPKGRAVIVLERLP